MIRKGIDLLLEATAPKTYKICYSPLGLYEVVYEYCNSCTLDWFLLESDSVSEVLTGERFNSFWSVVGFKMKEGSKKDLIYKCKYSGRPHLLVALGKWFATNNKLPHDDVVLIPIPLHWKRKFTRGYNQAELLAKGLGGVWDVEVDSWSLKRGMNKKSFTSSNRRSRSTLIKDVFYFSP